MDIVDKNYESTLNFVWEAVREPVWSSVFDFVDRPVRFSVYNSIKDSVSIISTYDFVRDHLQAYDFKN